MSRSFSRSFSVVSDLTRKFRLYFCVLHSLVLFYFCFGYYPAAHTSLYFCVLHSLGLLFYFCFGYYACTLLRTPVYTFAFCISLLLLWLLRCCAHRCPRSDPINDLLRRGCLTEGLRNTNLAFFFFRVARQRDSFYGGFFLGQRDCFFLYFRAFCSFCGCATAFRGLRDPFCSCLPGVTHPPECSNVKKMVA
jgi:hypothetical protein